MKLKQKILFALADVYGGGSFNIINFLYLNFLVLIIGIKALYAAPLILVLGIFNALTDSIMGRVTDRTTSKFGKRRIYLIVGAPLVALSFILLFFPFQIDDEILRIVVAAICYLTFDIIQTMVLIPYFALSSEISDNYQERASANSYRLGFSIFSSILCVAIPPMIINLFVDSPNPGLGYLVIGILFGVLFALCVLFTGLFAKEKVATPVATSKFSLQEIVKPFRIKEFRQYFYMFVFLQMSMAIMSGLFFFYIDFYYVKDITALGDSNMVSTIGAGLMFLVQIVALPFYLKMIERYNKKMVYISGGIIWIIMCVAIFFLPANGPSWLLFIFAALIGFGISGPGLAPHTMFGDIADYAELKFKERIDGSMSGFTNFCSKIAQSLGLAFVMLILGLFGFKEKDPALPAITSQPDNAMLALKIIFTCAPILLMSFGIYHAYHYNLNKKKHAVISEELSKIHANITTNETEDL